MNCKLTQLLCFLFFMIVFCCSPRKQKLACARFKEGDFMYHSATVNLEVKRFPLYQIETTREDGSITRLAINWISDCQYELRMIETTANYPPETLRNMKNITLSVDIIEDHDDYYVYRANAGIFYPTVTDTMWVKKRE